jgi:hypothetical protein
MKAWGALVLSASAIKIQVIVALEGVTRMVIITASMSFTVFALIAAVGVMVSSSPA